MRSLCTVSVCVCVCVGNNSAYHDENGVLFHFFSYLENSMISFSTILLFVQDMSSIQLNGTFHDVYDSFKLNQQAHTFHMIWFFVANQTDEVNGKTLFSQ